VSRRVRCALVPLGQGRLKLPAEASRYLLKVHRLRVGQQFLAFDPEAQLEADARLIDDHHGGATCEIGVPRAATLISTSPVTLFQALGKGDKVERVIRDATQLGVRRIVLVQTERSVPRVLDKRQLKQQRFERVALEAARQSGRGDVPSIEGPLSLARALSLAEPMTCKLVFDAGAEASVKSVLGVHEPGRGVGALIGPEGGLSAAELQTLQALGFSLVRLGPFTLRTETAAVAALAVLCEYC
jgi:16S rRNA (uracil1498-N3)-methyltransferase